jgi:predicted transcriptional regulator of viral defense system
MSGRGRRPKEPWVYMVSMADEFELPVFTSDSAKETAEFLGISQNGLHVCFAREGEGCVHRLKDGRYEVERFLPGE